MVEFYLYSNINKIYLFIFLFKICVNVSNI